MCVAREGGIKKSHQYFHLFPFKASSLPVLGLIWVLQEGVPEEMRGLFWSFRAALCCLWPTRAGAGGFEKTSEPRASQWHCRCTVPGCGAVLCTRGCSAMSLGRGVPLPWVEKPWTRRLGAGVCFQRPHTAPCHVAPTVHSTAVCSLPEYQEHISDQ